MKKKICIITGSRAEFGLLTPLIRKIKEENDFILQIIATGMHLSSEFGLTYKEIEKSGFRIDEKVEMLLSADTPQAISKSMGLGMIGFGEAFSRLSPDLIIVLGDRFEIFSAVSSALIARIPIAHIHGGEITEGAFDDALRHCITKMSQLHFTSTEEYRKRVIQLGENPDSVFNVGAIGIDNIKNLNLLSKSELEKSTGIRFNKQNLVVTFHPVTLENNTATEQFKNLLAALDELKETSLIFTKSNADTEGRIINKMIDDYAAKNSEKVFAFTSLGNLRYLSLLQYIDAAVGNSSSGIIEVPSFKKGTINIGNRQKGRIMPDSVICCEPSAESISPAIKKIYSPKFRQSLKTIKNPYGDGNTTDKIYKILKQKINDIKNTQKSFYDFK